MEIIRCCCKYGGWRPQKKGALRPPENFVQQKLIPNEIKNIPIFLSIFSLTQPKFLKLSSSIYISTDQKQPTLVEFLPESRLQNEQSTHVNPHRFPPKILLRVTRFFFLTHGRTLNFIPVTKPGRLVNAASYTQLVRQYKQFISPFHLRWMNLQHHRIPGRILTQ